MPAPPSTATATFHPFDPFDPFDHPIALELPRRVTRAATWVQHIPFGMTLVDLLRPRTIVELGTYWGDSYCAFCQAVALLQLETSCVAVDTWQGDAQTGLYDGVYEDLRAYHDPAYGAFSTLKRMTFDEAAGGVPDASIDLLHIDGLHTYDAVRHDFETWLPKVSSRGVVLFHDTVERGRDFGVWRLWGELAPRYPSFEFTHGHGLGVLGVGAELPADLRRFFQSASASASASADLDRVRQIYLTLGTRVGFFRICNQMMTHMFAAVQTLNAHQRATGGEVDPATESLATAQQQPVRFAQYLRECVERLCK